jgi:16S rRNA (adenine1518-N6/adenine1519-N6)-dimethyltransferase
MNYRSASHTARKRFGQNFLHDKNIIDKIIRSIAPQNNQHLVEVGPGKGALTSYLIDSCQQLDVIELDRDLIPVLEAQFAQSSHFQIYNQDALKFDFSTLTDAPRTLRLIGNLPYNISTPLIFHFMASVELFQDMHFMLQKEVVERLTAAPGSKTYGRLSILVQYLCHASQLFIVPPGAFIPQPKIESAIVQLVPKQRIINSEKLQHGKPADLAFIAKAAFSQRRKTLKNNLKRILSAEQIEDCEIAPTQRAETLSIRDFVALTDRYVQIRDLD